MNLLNTTSPASGQSCLLQTAWVVLDAAHDIRDTVTIEICRQVLDATYRSDTPKSSDLDVVFDFFR